MQLTIEIPDNEYKAIQSQAAFELRTPEEVIRRAFEVYQKRTLQVDELELSKLRSDKKSLLEANKNQANQIKELKKDNDDAHQSGTMVQKINRAIAATLKGDPGPTKLHDWSDLPKLVEEQKKALIIARSELSWILGYAEQSDQKSLLVRAQVGLQQQVKSNYDIFDNDVPLDLNQFEYMFAALLYEYCKQMREDPPIVMIKDPQYKEHFKDWANGFTTWRSW